MNEITISINEIFTLIPENKHYLKPKFISALNKYLDLTQNNKMEILKQVYEDISFGIDIEDIIKNISNKTYGKRKYVIYRDQTIYCPELSAKEWKRLI